MTKAELVDALDKANRRATFRAGGTRTVAEKMGVKPGSRAHFVDAPATALSAIDLPDLDVVEELTGVFDYLHYFVITQQHMRAMFPTLTPHVRSCGMLWLSWPKGGRLDSDLGLPKVIEIGLVESTCLRINDVWAGLKFTHPKKGKTYCNSHGTLPG